MKIFETVSFHIVKPCNMKCKFCYATFQDFKVQKQLTIDEICSILDRLHFAGVKKVTFAGGEPMLYKDLDKAIKHANYIGLTTSVITNGSLITNEWLQNMKPYLDWIGLSIDSFNKETNKLIGRNSKLNVNYIELLTLIKFHKYKLKINTVVNQFNKNEILNEMVDYFEPDRWKIFQALKVEGQNDKEFDEIKVSKKEFNNFISNNFNHSMVVESNDLMTGSYLLIDPLGRMFENTLGTHTYSDSLINHSIEHCLNQINLKRDKFLERGGIYEW